MGEYVAQREAGVTSQAVSPTHPPPPSFPSMARCHFSAPLSLVGSGNFLASKLSMELACRLVWGILPVQGRPLASPLCHSDQDYPR